MYLLFLDESGTPDPGEIFALGGVVIRADQWADIKERFDGCLSDSGWPADNEFKWSEISRSTAASDAAYPVYDLLAELPIKCLVTILYTDDSGPGYREKFFRDPETIYGTALTFVAERFQKFLELEDSHGVIVLDSRRHEEDDLLRRYFDQIHEEGTEFLKLDRIVDGLLLGPSHFSLGIQLADLVVGPTRANQIGKAGIPAHCFRTLKPNFMTHPDKGEIEGSGLKVFPDRQRKIARDRESLQSEEPAG